MGDAFFSEQSEQSEIKAEIVSKYFWAWAKVITAVQSKTPGREREPVQYVDLFCGRGRYQDGALSTPVKIVEQALTDPVLCERLVAIFNDKDQGNTDSLRECLQGLTGSGRLRTQPKIYTGEIDDDVARLFERTAQPRATHDLALGNLAGLGTG